MRSLLGLGACTIYGILPDRAGYLESKRFKFVATYRSGTWRLDLAALSSQPPRWPGYRRLTSGWCRRWLRRC